MPSCSAGKAATQRSEVPSGGRLVSEQTRSRPPRPSGARNRASRDTRAGWPSCRMAATRRRWSPVGADCSTHLAPADWSGEANDEQPGLSVGLARAVDVVSLDVSGRPGRRRSAPGNGWQAARAYRLARVTSTLARIRSGSTRCFAGRDRYRHNDRPEERDHDRLTHGRRARSGWRSPALRRPDGRGGKSDHHEGLPA